MEETGAAVSHVDSRQAKRTKFHMKGCWIQADLAGINSGTANGNVIVPINWPINPDSADCGWPPAVCRKPYEFSPLNFNTAGGLVSQNTLGEPIW